MSLFKMLNQSGTAFETFDTGGYNWDTAKKPGELRKSGGYRKWYGTAISTGDRWQELFILDDGTNRNICGVYGGKFYKFETNGSAVRIENATPVTFHLTDPICMVQYGAYALISSISTAPQKWMHGDAYLTGLIQAGTAFKFKFLEQFQNRIIGAYSDQTNGNIDIRWTNALPSMASLEFPATNQIYKPDSDVGITGMKRLGNLRLLLYGRASIHAIDYFPDYASEPFNATPIATGIGTDSHHSIVDTGSSHQFYDRNKGFIEMSGAGAWKVISDPVATLLETISSNYLQRIVGRYSRFTNNTAWIVPLDGAVTPSAMLIYSNTTGEWSRRNIAQTAFVYDHWDSWSGLTWTQLRALDTVNHRWPTSGKWSDYLTHYEGDMLFGNTTGYAYRDFGNDEDEASTFAAWRIEPVISQPAKSRTKRFQELHFEATTQGSFSLDVYWRGAVSEQAVASASWESIGSVSLAGGQTESILYFDKAAKFHQFKFGTDLKDEPFKISQYVLKGYVY